MIIDVCAHLGPWDRRPVGIDARGLAGLLAPFGVSRIYAGRLEALWFENPHDANLLDEPPVPGVVRVPVLDPTVATWPDELDRLARGGLLKMVRLLPSYGGYSLEEADPLLDALAKRGLVAQVIVRMDDPRRQHRRAQVPDLPTSAVRDAAARHPGLAVLLSGAQGHELLAMADRLPSARNLWADTSQADGVRTVADLMRTPWGDRLVFGSHAPLFIPYSAVARVVLDLDDPTALRVLRDNAAALLKAD
jgi:predicted TIM-barrel fold metal-dependent hydrolase